MTFTNILQGIACKCLDNCRENEENLFARRTGDTKLLKDRDFRTHHERGKVATNPEDCEEVCGLRGLSVHLWNEKSEKDLLERYMTTCGISPKVKNHLSIIKFGSGVGKVKHTPENNILAGEYHYDLYKSDTFAVDLVQLIQNIPLINNV